MFTAQNTDCRSQNFHEPRFLAAPCYHFAVTSAREPSVLLRVLELFAMRDLIPAKVRCQHTDGPEPGLRIEVSVAGLERQQAEHLALRMRNIAPVTNVMLDWS